MSFLLWMFVIFSLVFPKLAERKWGKDWRKSPLFLQAVRPVYLLLWGQLVVFMLFVQASYVAFLWGTIFGLIWGIACTSSALALAGRQRGEVVTEKRTLLLFILLFISVLCMSQGYNSEHDLLKWIAASTMVPLVSCGTILEASAMPYYLHVLMSYLTSGLLSTALWFMIGRHGLYPWMGPAVFGIIMGGGSSTWILSKREQLLKREEKPQSIIILPR